MRFLDTNIFVYAYYRPKKILTEKEQTMKELAKEIIRNVSSGKEQVTTTVVHVSEIVNILKNGLPQEKLTALISGLFMLNNVIILDVTKDAYFAATEISNDLKLEPNDTLAIDIMRQNGICEIYTFDEHFSNIDGIVKLPYL
jgi:uncharacterized protein